MCIVAANKPANSTLILFVHSSDICIFVVKLIIKIILVNFNWNKNQIMFITTI